MMYFRKCKPTCTAALEARRWTTRATHSDFIDSDEPKLVVGERGEMKNDRVEVPWVRREVSPLARQPVIIIKLH